MAIQAGTIETQLTADVRQFTSGMASAERSFRQTVSAFQQGSPQAADALKKITDTVDQIRGGVDRLTSTFNRGMGMIGAGMIVPSIMEKAKSAVFDFNQQLDAANITMKMFLGSQPAADKMLATLQDFAARTPFNFQDLLGLERRCSLPALPPINSFRA